MDNGLIMSFVTLTGSTIATICIVIYTVGYIIRNRPTKIISTGIGVVIEIFNIWVYLTQLQISKTDNIRYFTNTTLILSSGILVMLFLTLLISASIKPSGLTNNQKEQK